MPASHAGSDPHRLPAAAARQRWSHAVTTQQADDQLRLCAAGNGRHRDKSRLPRSQLFSSGHYPTAATGTTVPPWEGSSHTSLTG
jgi:hypothetical protein